MKEIAIDQTREGDILARDIKNNNGAAILFTGTVLSASMISRLKKMGIQFASIKDQSPEGDPETIARQLALLEQRFNGTESNPYMQELKTIVTDHIKKAG